MAAYIKMYIDICYMAMCDRAHKFIIAAAAKPLR